MINLKLTDILKLETRAENLNIIKSYLDQSLSDKEYYQAFFKYIEMAFELNLFEIVITQGAIFYEKFLDRDYKEKNHQVLKYLIDSAMKLDKLDLAYQYIEIRKTILPMVQSFLYTVDLIEYKQTAGEPYLDELLRLYKEAPKNNWQIYALKHLYEFYMNARDYHEALKYLTELNEKDESQNYDLEILELHYKLRNYEHVITHGEDLRLKDKRNVRLGILLMEAYITLNLYDKVTILEPEYEELIDNEPVEVREKAYKLIINFYQNLFRNDISLKHYEDKYKKLKKVLSKQIQEKAAEVEEKTVVEVLVPRTEGKAPSQLLKHFHIILEALTFSHQIDENLKLRDYLRIFFMHLDHKVDAKEYILYRKSDEANLFHYKKERLYDKHILDALCKNTLIEKVMEESDSFFGSFEDLKFKNILTQMPYYDDIQYVYAFPLSDFGVFIIHLEEKITDPTIYYDLYKGIATILEAKLLDERSLGRLRSKNDYYMKILNCPIVAYRDMTDISSKYNEGAKRMLNIATYEHLEVFLKDVIYDKVHPYKDLVKRLFNHEGAYEKISYQYQDKFIEEHMYSLKFEDTIHIISIFNDMTQDYENKSSLYEKATIDFETGLSNKHALIDNIDHYLSDKATFILLELDMSVKSIYGSAKMMQFLKEFANVTKKQIDESICYRFDFNQVMVVLPYNDIRSVTKAIKDYYRYLETYQAVSIPYEKFKAYASILRYPVVTTDTNHEHIFKYLDVGLEISKRNQDTNYHFFVYTDYENEVFEQNVIDQLNQALELKQLVLSFNQITDIKHNRIWQYESQVTLEHLNIDSKYLYTIAQKRNRLIDLEKYHIEAVCRFLQRLEKETNKLIRITIQVSKTTFIETGFNEFLIGTIRKYQIPAEFIRIVTDSQMRSQSYLFKVQELINFGISLDTKITEQALSANYHALHLEVKDLSDRWLMYLKNLNETLHGFQVALICRDVKTKEMKEQLEKIGIRYIEGKIYKQLDEQTLIDKIKVIS